mgnify:CR=1 FL=1
MQHSKRDCASDQAMTIPPFSLVKYTGTSPASLMHHPPNGTLNSDAEDMQQVTQVAADTAKAVITQ